MKEFSNGGKNNKEHIFGYRLSSARMTIEYSFVHLKARFACFNRNINLKDLPNVIYACFVLHNFCEIQKELIHQNDPSNALKNDARLQPQTSGNYTIIINEGNGKAIRNTFVKYICTTGSVKYGKYVKYIKYGTFQPNISPSHPWRGEEGASPTIRLSFTREMVIV